MAGLLFCHHPSLPPSPGLDVHQPHWPGRQLDRLGGLVEHVCQAPEDDCTEDGHREHGEIKQEEHLAIAGVGAEQEAPGLVLWQKGRPAGGKGAPNTRGQRRERRGRELCCRWKGQG